MQRGASAMKHDISNLTFSFCGDYEVDALSVSKAISSLVEISKIIADREYPNVEFRLSVKAIQPGSLEFCFIAAAAYLQTLLLPGNIEYAANLISLISSMFSIKHFLKRKKPKSVIEEKNSIKIISLSGAQLELPKGAGVYFVDQRVDNSISNIFQNAKLSEGISGISIKPSNGQTVHIPKQDFELCSMPIENEEEEIRVLRKDEILYVRQPDLSGDRQWIFKSDKFLHAEIKDNNFLEKVRAGIPMSARTYLIADIEMVMKKGLDGLPDENKTKYSVIRVKSIHQPQDTQIEGQTKL